MRYHVVDDRPGYEACFTPAATMDDAARIVVGYLGGAAGPSFVGGAYRIVEQYGASVVDAAALHLGDKVAWQGHHWTVTDMYAANMRTLGYVQLTSGDLVEHVDGGTRVTVLPAA